MQSFGYGGHLVQQDRRRLEVPVGIGCAGMAEIGGQREHVPTDLPPIAGNGALQSTHREAVAQIMQAQAELTREPDNRYWSDESG